MSEIRKHVFLVNLILIVFSTWTKVSYFQLNWFCVSSGSFNRNIFSNFIYLLLTSRNTHNWGTQRLFLFTNEENGDVCMWKPCLFCDAKIFHKKFKLRTLFFYFCKGYRLGSNAARHGNTDQNTFVFNINFLASISWWIAKCHETNRKLAH